MKNSIVFAERPQTGLVTPTTYEDMSRNRAVCTVTGTTLTRLPSGLWVRNYSLNNYVTAPTPAANFTSSAFSGCAWVKTTDLTANNYIFTRGLGNTDGWVFALASTGSIIFATYQAAATQVSSSAVGAVVTATWYFLAFTRAGAVGKVYRNAVDVTSTSGIHVAPLTSARTLKIGAYDNLTLALIGSLVWVRLLNIALTAEQIASIFQSERGWFGV